MWEVPKFWVGQTVVILASGHGMSAQVAEQVRRSGCPTIVINNTFTLAPWADLLYAADETWWHQTPDALNFAGIKVSVGRIKGVLQLRNTGTTGWDPHPGALRTGGNSGYQALHLAMHTGAKRILLCGFNMGGPHWHKDHQTPLQNTVQERYPSWIRRFYALEEQARKMGVEIINCTPESALDAFPMGNLQAELNREWPASMVSDVMVEEAHKVYINYQRGKPEYEITTMIRDMIVTALRMSDAQCR